MGPQGLCLVVTPTPESLILTLSVPRAGNRKPEAEHKSFSVEISEAGVSGARLWANHVSRS